MSGTTATGVVKYLVETVCARETVLVDLNYLPELFVEFCRREWADSRWCCVVVVSGVSCLAFLLRSPSTMRRRPRLTV